MTESEIVSGVSMNCVQRRKKEMNSRRTILSSRPDRVSSGCRGRSENIRSSASCGRQKHKHKIVQAVFYEQIILSTILVGFIGCRAVFHEY